MLLEVVGKSFAHSLVDGTLHLGVAKFCLGLTFKLGLCHLDGDDCSESLAEVLRRNLNLCLLNLLRNLRVVVGIFLQGASEGSTEAGEVCSTLHRINIVHVRVDVLGIVGVVHHCHLDRNALLLSFEVDDIIDKMNYMLASCTKVMFGNMPGSYKDILDHDRFYLIKRIQELTFKNGETAINIPVPDGACKTPGCKPQAFVKLTSDMIERAELDETLEKYYDEVNKCYSIKTKHYGVIQMAPPTIGVTSIVRDWAVNRAQNQKHWDQSLVQMIPFFRREWRQFRDKDVFDMATEFENWDIDKYTLIYRLIEKMNTSVGMSPNIHVRCESCGGDIEVPVMFQDISDDGKEVRGGFKSLFVSSLSDRLDELS